MAAWGGGLCHPGRSVTQLHCGPTPAPVVGSSRNMTGGFPSAAIATDSRRFMPPEKPPTSRSATDVSLTSCSTRRISGSTAAAGRPFTAVNSARVSRAVSVGHNMSCCGHTPITFWTCATYKSAARDGAMVVGNAREKCTRVSQCKAFVSTRCASALHAQATTPASWPPAGRYHGAEGGMWCAHLGVYVEAVDLSNPLRPGQEACQHGNGGAFAGALQGMYRACVGAWLH